MEEFFSGVLLGAPISAAVHIVAHQGSVVAVDGGRGVIQSGQQVFLDIADIGGVLPHTVQHILDVGAVQLQEPGLDHLRRVVVPGNADGLPVGAHRIHHELHQFVQTVPVKRMVSDEVVILDVLQNQFPVVLPFPHPIPSGPIRAPGGLGA